MNPPPPEPIHTFCRICEPGCGLLAEVRDGAVHRLRPDPDHPVHQGFCCHKGVHYLQVHRDPDRLNHPLRRTNPRSEPGEFATVGWDAAVHDIADRIRAVRDRHGPDALAVYQGNPSAFNGAYYANAARIARGFGTRMRFSAGTQDTSAKYAASEAIYGSALAHPIPDLLHTGYFLCLGSNPAVSHMTLLHISDPMAKLRAITARGGTVRFVNPRQIESATAETGDVLLIRPNADFFFLAGVLHEIVFRIGFDRAAVESRARGVDDLLAVVRRYPPERVAPVTGIGAAEIRRVADEFCAAPSASIYMATGVNQGRLGAAAYWMLTMISLFSGNLGRRGGNIYARGIADAVLGSKRRRADPFFDHQVGPIRTVAGDLPAALLPEFIGNPETPIRALIVVSGNPLLSVGGEDRLRRAFAELDLLVTVDLYRTLTGELADYLLPATDWLERADVNYLSTLGVALEPYVQYTPAVVPPAAQRRDDWWILSRIQQELGVPTLLDDPEPDPFAPIEATLRAAGTGLADLAAQPCGTRVLPEPDPAHVFDIAVRHDDGLIDCCPDLFARSLGAIEAVHADLAAADPDRLELITRRTHHMVNSWLHNLPVFDREIDRGNPLWMHPADARRRDLVEGDLVTVRNRFGSLEATLRHDAGLRRGVVALSHGWGQQGARGLGVARDKGGANANVLAPTGRAGFDPLSNQSQLTGITVEVARAGATTTGIHREKRKQ
ncbi:molybdopterin-containing oxidoreductase family protein [Nocardia barduliensis]|uniref:molybdopterin-containing oxidoreductase family protein n=1 Tax=Nocardia barduliensis TaxID=2736643 RepID=UPI0015734D36|nr:molybdopterin-dependent oxidoreductase [Nocardia barduliensis]